jgi:hypothetical protein
MHCIRIHWSSDILKASAITRGRAEARDVSDESKIAAARCGAGIGKPSQRERGRLSDKIRFSHGAS